ncbi:MAG TPA: hypothetical protein VII06_40810 [Chloroflexota bacterium]|jgi:hypothetical protein
MLAIPSYSAAEVAAVLEFAPSGAGPSPQGVPPCPPRLLSDLRRQIHRWHRHAAPGQLTAEAQAYLAARRGAITCPHCQEPC